MTQFQQMVIMDSYKQFIRTSNNQLCFMKVQHIFLIL